MGVSRRCMRRLVERVGRLSVVGIETDKPVGKLIVEMSVGIVMLGSVMLTVEMSRLVGSVMDRSASLGTTGAAAT